MDVLIRGMEMPTSCCNCIISKLSPTGQTLICNYTLSTVPWDDKPFDCPLFPIQTPHGRSIDVDAAIADLKAMCEEAYGTDNIPSLIELAIEYFTNVPTTIPASEEGKE